MATETPTETVLNEYLVVADMVVVETGREVKPGEREVARMENGSTIFALPDNPSIIDLLSMGGVVLKKGGGKVMRELRDRGNHYRPTVDGRRITAAGTATLMLNGDEPEPVDPNLVPGQFTNPDISLPGEDVPTA